MSNEHGAKAKTDRAKAPALSQQRLMLSAGYSMLYKDASTLDLSELILYVKVESEAMKKVTTAVAGVGGQLKKDLERIAKDYPGVISTRCRKWKNASEPRSPRIAHATSHRSSVMAVVNTSVLC